MLKGAYRDELGVFAAGDFAAAYGELNHQPMVVEGDETLRACSPPRGA